MSQYPEAPYFRIAGFLDRLPVSAEWKDGYLTADPELFEMAELLVAAGEEFSAHGTVDPVKAGLDDPLAAALTMIRSMEGITKADVILDANSNDQVKIALETPTTGELPAPPGRTGGTHEPGAAPAT